MKIIHKNLKKGELKVEINNLDDLWYLSQMIDTGDLAKAKTIRKIKLGEVTDRKSQVIKKSVFMTIQVEKVEFHKYSNNLRISGKVIAAPEDISKGSFHTFDIEVGNVIEIIKEKWLRYQLQKIQEASQTQIPSILICVMGRDEAHFALSKRYGYDFLTSLEGEVAKKDKRVNVKPDLFYHSIIKKLEEYAQRYKLDNIIIASPAFWKEELFNIIKDNQLKKMVVFATCSSSDKTALNEVLKRQEVQNVLKQDRIARELKIVDDLLREISKDGKAAYGIDEVENAANAGAVAILLITDSFIHEMKEKELFDKIDDIMKLVDNTDGDIHIISSDNDAGKKLDGLGGIASILRYQLNY